MFLRFRVWKYRFTFTLSPVSDVIGVNSKMRDGRHILMWDFDETSECEAFCALATIQRHEHLPNIYLLESSPGGNYIAYCFQACDWWTCKRIIASTQYVDENFFKYGVNRDYFTLRVSEKQGHTPKLIYTLKSDRPETANIHNLESWVVYETLIMKAS